MLTQITFTNMFYDFVGERTFHTKSSDKAEPFDEIPSIPDVYIYQHWPLVQPI